MGMILSCHHCSQEASAKAVALLQKVDHHDTIRQTSIQFTPSAETASPSSSILEVFSDLKLKNPVDLMLRDNFDGVTDGKGVALAS